MKNINKKLFVDLAKKVGLNAAHLEILGESRYLEIVVGNDMLDRLIEIQQQFEQLEVMGDDEYRGFYIEIPRPEPEEWDNEEELIASGEYENHEAFMADWLAYNPTETQWVHIASSKYNDYRSIHVTDLKRTRFIITNCTKYGAPQSDDTLHKEYLIHFFDFLQKVIDVVVANPDEFNEYVANNLPYQQRTGRISQKDFNRIVPNHKIQVEDLETSVKALEDSVNEISAPFLENMTIRKYCSYYRIASEAYEKYYQKYGFNDRVYTDPQDISEDLRDVVYYERKKYVDLREMYDIDSPEDFTHFANDHYGELGLSRLNIFALNDEPEGWKIVVSNSYSANIELAIEVATALYKAGAPLLIYDAEKLLRVLQEKDYVRLVPDAFHNYMGYQKEGVVYELPWEYECCDTGLTLEQYKEIVSLTEWQPERQVQLAKTEV